MPFAVSARRLPCLFHFINNMSVWHFSCSRALNQAWIEETGPLRDEEALAVSQFAGIASEYPFGDSWLGRIFMTAPTENEAWEKALILLGEKQVQVLRTVFAALEARFDRIWKDGQGRLETLGMALGGVLDSAGVDQVLAMLEGYLLSPCPSVEIHLVLNPIPSYITHGGANEGPGHVTLGEAKDIGAAVEVVLHETMHLMEHERFLPMYMEFSEKHHLDQIRGEKSWSAHHLIREAITGAVFPGGCLSPILGHERRDFQAAAERGLKSGDIRGYGLAHLTGSYLPLAESYIRLRKPIDLALLEQVYFIFADQRPALRF
jgi:hypothetical protein